MKMTVEMEILCVGNELLIGKTLNTNAQWIAKRSTLFGVIVKRITVVGDDINEIATATVEALKRRPQFIIVTGGLGPTFDDKTAEGVAKGLRRKLAVNHEALEMVKEKYVEFVRHGRMEKMELTQSRVKMAKLPKDAKPLANPIGTAPGIMIALKETVFMILPGVPSEMEAIFEESIVPMLRKETGNLAFFEASIFAYDIMESALAPLIDQTMRDNPHVYIKSHPRGQEGVPKIELHFSTTAGNSRVGKNRLRKAIRQLSELIRGNGGKTRTMRKT